MSNASLSSINPRSASGADFLSQPGRIPHREPDIAK